MSSRNSRRKKPKQDVSASHFVGYVLDDEPIDAIMKKFEELERFEREKAQSVEQHEAEEKVELTDKDLEEIFKRTSSYSVEAALNPEHVEQVFEIVEESEEEDYIYLNEDEWQREVEGKSIRKSRPRKDKRVGIRVVDKEALAQHQKHMQIHLGEHLIPARRKRDVDPSLPSYCRLPPEPIPASWVKHIQPLKPEPQGTLLRVDRILDGKWKEWFPRQTFQAILMDPPFSSTMEPGKITLQQWSRLPLLEIIPFGLLFVWVEKEFICQVVTTAERVWNFRYVENFVWIKKNWDNTIVKQPGKYFSKSKLTCLIFRRDGQIDLRHQRNPDCEFDFVKPPGETEEKPNAIYNVIETMLPEAHDMGKQGQGGLLQLWGSKRPRQGWITVIDS